MLLIPIEKIFRDETQPRKEFNKNKIDELAQSIKKNGLIQPLIVTKRDLDTFLLVAGERRWRAAQSTDLKVLPALLLPNDLDKDEISLIENIQREDLNPIEEAKGYKYLQENLQSSITEIAKTVGKSRPAVSNALRLLKLPDQIQDSILKGEINAGQARAILQRKTSQGMLQIWQKLLTDKISVRKTEKLASKRKVSPQLQNIQDKLSRLIGEKVVINQNAKTKKGFIKINFSKKTVSRVLDKLQSIKSD